ncbi:hypothetical protein FIBSPDRAFT_943141 [Athelia psychrophila]|uniref:HNH nuclease domain-containing protein n=1 Tax=Athelia psychrophila TaxID=1759441 RepID=A0A166WT28_9AGAM|nr:hypothetical protein FIBSPDRAFT_943141 [Fibularhizoctonia sp. CBS 109695]
MDTDRDNEACTPSLDQGQDPVSIPHHTSPRPERLPLFLSSTQSQKLLALDDGICLITGDKAPKIAIEYAHIVQRRLPVSKIKYYERLWGLPAKKLDLDSRFNRVHLRSDLHYAYDANLWALVLTEDILKHIMNACVGLLTTGKRHCMDNIIPEEIGNRYSYVFVPLQISKMAPRIMRTERDNTWSMHHAPFGLFPLLQHNSHPYYAILNAHLKFQAIEDESMLPEHKALRNLVKLIYSLWCALAPQTVAPETIFEGSKDNGQGVSGDNEDPDYGHGRDGGERDSTKRRGRDEVRAYTEHHGMDGGGRQDFLMDVNTNSTRSRGVTHGRDLPPITPCLVQEPLTSSTSLSRLPDLGEPIKPSDSASVVASEASTGLRSDDEEEAQDRHHLHPSYHWNVDAWRKGVVLGSGT